MGASALITRSTTGSRSTSPFFYYLRYQVSRKRTWEPVGGEPSLGIVGFDRRAHALQGIVLGNSEPVVPVSLPAAKPESDPAKRLRADCVTKYIIEITEHKAAKNHTAGAVVSPDGFRVKDGPAAHP
jgi:hypothetical protein